MAKYTPHTVEDVAQMCATIGVKNISELFAAIPEHVKLKTLDLPQGLSQYEVENYLSLLSQKNKVFTHVFRGAGAYQHYIPPVVKNLAQRSEFLTAYTPYQPEVSQGILQIIFEFQSHICRLTGLDVSNASIYDGATSAAEAIKMCIEKNRNTVILPDNINPDTLSVVTTYLKPLGVNIEIFHTHHGVIDIEQLTKVISDKVACIYFEQVNYFGLIEDSRNIVSTLDTHGIRTVLGTNPIALALLPSAAEVGATIAVGEGQPLGIPLSFGGPYLGYIACKNEPTLVRRMPGRIVGETLDSKGQRAFVLTLQTREQHIRREKALSSICSNQAHCALVASLYLSYVGKEGLQEIASQCLSKAHYMATEFSKIKGLTLKHTREFFHEFVIVSTIDTSVIEKTLSEHDILSGLPLNSSEMLWCCTELSSRESIDKTVSIIKKLLCN